MSGPDTFFASDSLADLFVDHPHASHKTFVEIDGVNCLLISYTSTGRVLQMNIGQRYNPFEMFGVSSINASIIFPKGNNKKLEYTNYSFKIEQLNDSWLVTIGDKDE